MCGDGAHCWTDHRDASSHHRPYGLIISKLIIQPRTQGKTDCLQLAGLEDQGFQQGGNGESSDFLR